MPLHSNSLFNRPSALSGPNRSSTMRWHRLWRFEPSATSGVSIAEPLAGIPYPPLSPLFNTQVYTCWTKEIPAGKFDPCSQYQVGANAMFR